MNKEVLSLNNNSSLQQDSINLRSSLGKSLGRLLIAGDLAPIDLNNLMHGELDFVIHDSILEMVNQSDYSIVNLETPLTQNPKPIEKLGPVLRGDPNAAGRIKNYGFDAVSCANNHVLDCGESAVLETIEYCKSAGLDVVGCGGNITEASKPLSIEINGIKIAIFAFAESEFCLAADKRPGAASLYNPEIFPSIVKQKNNSDLVIVLIHAGNEYYQLPRPGLVRLCRSLIDLGCDAVVGHHPHVFGGYEIWKGKPVVYSLGNFLFPTARARPDGWDRGLLAELALDGKGVYSFRIIPIIQDIAVNKVKLADKNDADEMIQAVLKLSEIIQDSTLLEKHWNEYCRKLQRSIFIFKLKGLRYLKKLLSILGFSTSTVNSFLFRLSYSRKNRLGLMNEIRCESHRERDLTILNQLIDDSN